MKEKEISRNVEQILLELYNHYESGKNWDAAATKINTLIKNVVNEEQKTSKKLALENKQLKNQLNENKVSLSKTTKRNKELMKVTVPKLVNEVVRLEKQNETYSKNTIPGLMKEIRNLETQLSWTTTNKH